MDIDQSQLKTFDVACKRLREVLKVYRGREDNDGDGGSSIAVELTKTAEEIVKLTRDARSVMEIVLREEVLILVREGEGGGGRETKGVRREELRATEWGKKRRRSR